jgi:hypothetical protein
MYDGLSMPDLAVYDVVRAAIDALVVPGNSTVDLMLARRPDAEREMIVTALQTRPGEVRVGIPLENLHDWSVIVSMAGNTPKRHTVGDELSGIDELPVATTTLAAAITADEELDLPLVRVPMEVAVGSRGRLRIEDELAIYEKLNNGTVRLHGRGVQGTVAAAHATGTTVVFHVLSRVVGWVEGAQVRVDVLASNSLFAVNLARLLKAFLVAQQDTFDQQGLVLHEIAETDLAPRPAAWPAHLYTRTLTASLTAVLEVPVETPVVTGVEDELLVEGTTSDGTQHAEF